MTRIEDLEYRLNWLSVCQAMAWNLLWEKGISSGDEFWAHENRLQAELAYERKKEAAALCRIQYASDPSNYPFGGSAEGRPVNPKGEWKI